MANPELIPTWSPNGNYMRAGQQNPGTLTLKLGKGSKEVQLGTGDYIQIPDLPTGWSITPGTADWAWKSSGKKSGLAWKGNGTFDVSADNDSQPIQLSVTAPSGAQSEQVSLQLYRSDGTTKLSSAADIMFSLTAAQASLTAYAGPSAYVILTSSSALHYGNTIDCDLLALAQVSQTQLTLSFHGTDASGNPVDLSGSVDSVNLQITAPGMSFSSKGDGTWTANLPGLSQGQTLDVHITGLSISQTSQNPIVLLEVRCKTENDTASAWYTAFGPYTVGVALDPNGLDHDKYRFGCNTSGTSIVGIQDASVVKGNQVLAPLDWFILNADKQLVFPPVAARFSLNGQDPIEQQSESPYKLGANTLCWVDESDKTIAQCEIDVIGSMSAGPFDFSGMDLSGWNFSQWSNLGNSLDPAKASNFTNAVLVGTNLDGARLDKCKMDGVTIHGNFYPNTMTGTSFKGASFKGASFGGNVYPAQGMTQCDLSGCDFDGATLQGWTLNGCKLDSATFNNATSKNVIVENGSLVKTVYSKTAFTAPTFTTCDVSLADFSGSTFPNWTITSGLTAPGGLPRLPDGWKLENGSFVKD